MQSKATTVAQYLAALPDDRRKTLDAVRRVIRKNLDKNFEEGIQYGMIGYYVPHRVYPPGYHCDPKQPLPYVALASQKNYMSLYLMCIYGHDELRDSFEAAWAKSGKKLDMGKSCIRFKKLDDLALDVIGQAIKKTPAKKFVAHYEATMARLKAQKSKTQKAKPLKTKMSNANAPKSRTKSR